MSIPIKDINAGDSISSMVDKINYNFDLIALKGGGARGIQGIQGISGHTGVQGSNGIQGLRGIMFVQWNNSIYDGAPAANGCIVGDITIAGNGDVLEVMNVNGVLTWVKVQNLATVTESPFFNYAIQGVNAAVVEKPTTFPKPIVLGQDPDDPMTEDAIADIVGNINRPAIAITALDKGYNPNNPNGCVYNSGIEFYTGGNTATADGEVTLDNGSLLMRSRNGITLGYCVNGNPVSSIKMDGNGTEFLIRKNLDNDNTKYLLMTTTGQDGILTNDKSWYIDPTEHCIAPNKSTGYDIGRKTNNDINPIKDIYFGNNSKLLYYDNSSQNPSLTVARIEHATANEGIVKIMEHGILLDTESNTSIARTSSFGIEIFDKNANKGTANFISFNKTAHKGTNIISQDSATIGNEQNFNSKTLGYSIDLGANNYTSENRIRRHISPTITVYAATNTVGGSDKNSEYVLTLKGMNGNRVGHDVLICGGDCDTTSTASSKVGGDVYISGGSNITQNGTNGVKGSLRNFGNVIIGINPNNHTGLFNPANYKNDSDVQVKNAKSDPDGVQFFDINDVTVHANKITLDSNANYRKLTGYSATVGSGGMTLKKFQNPWVESPEYATLQLNGINTIYHKTPFTITYNDASKYQLLSGVMAKTYQIYYDEAADRIDVVDEKQTLGEYDMSGNREQNSIYLDVEQVWQKVGNTVNVNARCMWFAYNTNRQKFYAITENMFTKDGNEEWYKQDVQGTILNRSYTWRPYNETLMWCISTNYRTRNTPTPIQRSAKPSPHDVFTENKGVITVLENPISITNARNSYVYGNGAIETTNQMRSSKETIAVPPSNSVEVNDNHFSMTPLINNIIGFILRSLNKPNYGALHYSVIHSSNVTIGGNMGSGFGFTNNTQSLNNKCNFIHGDNGEIHNSSSANPIDIHSNSYRVTDKRMDRTAAFGGSWNENCDSIVKSVFYDSATTPNINYIIPEYNMSGSSRRDDSQDYYYDYELSRPCLGLYTSMHLNYSYVLGGGFSEGGRFRQFNKEENENIGTPVIPSVIGDAVQAPMEVQEVNAVQYSL